MNPEILAAADQAAARERELDRIALGAVRVLMLLAGVVALYAALACFGALPSAGWSPLGSDQPSSQPSAP